MARYITKEGYQKLLSLNCNKQKHRFRTNHFGITWCTICGTISNKFAQKLQENEQLIIT